MSTTIYDESRKLVEQIDQRLQRLVEAGDPQAKLSAERVAKAVETFSAELRKELQLTPEKLNRRAR